MNPQLVLEEQWRRRQQQQQDSAGPKSLSDPSLSPESLLGSKSTTPRVQGSTDFVDTVIIGNGPAALLLSYVLSGHEPHLRADNPSKPADTSASTTTAAADTPQSPSRPCVHPDPQLQAKLSSCFLEPQSSSVVSTSNSDSVCEGQLPPLTPPSLLDADVPYLTSHFQASRISYSTQALPVNVLFDTLIRPLADTETGQYASCIEWRPSERVRVPHLLLGSAPRAGGQWQENPVRASWDIGTLSYADLLNLPGYSLEEHLRRKKLTQGGRHVYSPETAEPEKPSELELEPAEFLRPSRRDVAEYLATYPTEVGIAENVKNGTTVAGISRDSDGFYIHSHNLRCRNLVLASGTFSVLIPPRPALFPLLRLPGSSLDATYNSPKMSATSSSPLLIVGSGFSAADLLITHLPHRKCIHIYKWDAHDNVSPLRACHPHAYPEYAAVYRRMKTAAKRMLGPEALASPLAARKGKKNPFETSQLEDQNYEGLPNTFIQRAEVNADGETAKVWLELDSGEVIEREVCGLQYVIGRRGSLDYLDGALRQEVLAPSPTISSSSAFSDNVQPPAPAHNGAKSETIFERKFVDGLIISGQTLRSKAEESIEMAPSVFAIGSLLGDSLVRFAYGGCCAAAGKIVNGYRRRQTENVMMSASIAEILADSLPMIVASEIKDVIVGNGLEEQRDVSSAVESNHDLHETEKLNRAIHEALETPISSFISESSTKHVANGNGGHEHLGFLRCNPQRSAHSAEPPSPVQQITASHHEAVNQRNDDPDEETRSAAASASPSSSTQLTRQLSAQQEQQQQQQSPVPSWWHLKCAFEKICKEDGAVVLA